MRLLLAVAATSLVGCAHVPAPAAVAAVPAVEDARPWQCSVDGKCARVAPEALDVAKAATPPVPNTSSGEWTVVAAGRPPEPTDWMKDLSPAAKTVVDVAAMLAQGAR